MHRQFVVTTTPDDPSLNAEWVGPARTALEALDAFAVDAGYVPYSHLVDSRQEDPVTDEDFSYIGQDADGIVWAVFLNSTVFAIPFDVEGSVV
jgi:hypothetical protein